MQLNSPAVSKINWTNGVAFVAAVAAVFGLDIPLDLQAKVVTGIAIGLPIVNMVLRTFFTGKSVTA